MEIWRIRTAVAIVSLSASLAFGQTNGVQAQLSLKGGQSSYRTGEPIVLDLAFTAYETGHDLNVTTTQPASPIDQITVTPADGAFNWLQDSQRTRMYVPDYETDSKLEPGQPEHVELPLNAVFRFDKPGKYTVHVATRRVRQAGMPWDRQEPLITNDVTFTVIPTSEAGEQMIVDGLMRDIRNAPNARSAQNYVDKLAWLSGEASTRAKIDLYLHPQILSGITTNTRRDLWIARDRKLIVDSLEGAIADLSSPIVNDQVSLAAEMKATLAVPAGPNAVGNLIQLDPKEARPYVIQAICGPQKLPQFELLTKMPVENMPEVDGCLLKELQDMLATKAPWFPTSQKVILAGRFASKEIYPQVLALYQQYGKSLDPNAKGAMLAYLAVYNSQAGLKLIEAAIPLDGGHYSLGPLLLLCMTHYSPAVDQFLREALESEFPQVASNAAEEMSMYGPPEDEQLILGRLTQWQDKWNGINAPEEQYRLQAVLINSLVRAKNWHEDDSTVQRLKAQCVVSDACKAVIRQNFPGLLP